MQISLARKIGRLGCCLLFMAKIPISSPLRLSSSLLPRLAFHVQPITLRAFAIYVPRIYPPKHTYSYNYRTPTINRRAIKKPFSLPLAATEMEETNGASAEVTDAEKLRYDFLQVLRSRRPSDVELRLEPAKPVLNPLFQVNTRPNISKAMESCPRVEIKNFKELLKEENLYLITEQGEQGRLPVLILSLEDSTEKRPAVVFLHGTSMCKEWLRPLLEAYASRGYVAIAIDSRYHGERARTKTTYQDALVSSWKKADTMPFIFDTVWDLIKLADYLTQREDIDPTSIGITGESLGGMHAWFGAFVETRYAVAVPIIGVQGFRWAIDNDKWQARVDSIKPVFEEARIDLGKTTIDKEVVEKVWDKIAPGLASSLDSSYTIPAIAPRPLLILNGANDPRCPLGGLEIPKSRAIRAYGEAHCDKFKLIAEPGIGHEMTSLMLKEASDWFDKFFKHQASQVRITHGAGTQTV